MVGVIIFVVSATALLSWSWVRGIDYMKENHPEYKGNQDGFDFDELKDWDVTVADGLDELEEQEKIEKDDSRSTT